jgi:flagellin-like protein
MDMKIIHSKKAISPVITTVLLVLLVLVLASIIIIWWRSFMGETITKFDESSKTQKSIEQFCSRVSLEVNIIRTNVTIVNTGSIPVYKFGFKKTTVKTGEIKISENSQIIGGSSRVIDISLMGMSAPVSGDQFYLIPILLGNNDKGEQKEFQCPEENWKKII